MTANATDLMRDGCVDGNVWAAAFLAAEARGAAPPLAQWFSAALLTGLASAEQPYPLRRSGEGLREKPAS